MAITLDKLLGAYKQRLSWMKNQSGTVVAGQPYTTHDRTGWPLNRALAVGDVVTGLVPTGAETGFAPLETPQGSNKLYISKVEIGAPVAMSVWLFDVLFWAGATTIPTSGTTTVSLSTPPSFQARVPYMSDGSTRAYNEVSLFSFPSTAGSAHAHSISIDYLDQAGNSGNTGNIVTTSIPVNRLLMHALASGDTGVSAIAGYKVNGATSSTGAMNIMAARSLGRYRTLGGLSSIYGPDYTGLPEVFANTAILMVVMADSTASSTPYVNLEISHIDPAA
jgi:hypothetical protein